MEGILEAYVDHDLERFQSFFADDIVALRPGAPTMLGSEWNQFTERVFAYLSVSKMSIEPIDITIVSDDTAIECHLQSATNVVKETGESNQVFQQGMYALRRDDGGRWLVTHYAWNSIPEFEPTAERAFFRTAE